MLSLRFITKYFSVNYDKLIVMNDVLDKYRQARMVARAGSSAGADESCLRTPISDFGWMAFLGADFDKLHGEWQSHFSAALNRGRAGGVPVNIEQKKRLLAERGSNSEMWNALQETKYKYQAIAADRKGGFIKDCKDKLTGLSQIPDQIEDKLIQQGTVRDPDGHPVLANSGKAALYVAYIGEFGRTYDRAQVTGAENELQRQVLVEEGLYRCVKYAFNTGQSIASVVGGAVTFDNVKSIVKNAASLVNTAAGLIAGMKDVIEGKEGDFRTLSARYGWDAEAGELKIRVEKDIYSILGLDYTEDMRFNVADDLARPGLSDAARANLMDRDRALERQTPAQMAAQAQRMLQAAEKDRHEIRHSLFWVKVFERDIRELRDELESNDATDGRRVLMRELQLNITQLAARESAEDSDSLVPSQLTSLGAEAVAQMSATTEKLTPILVDFELRLKQFKDLLVQAEREIDRLVSGADTRIDITNTQFRLAAENLPHNLPQLLAQEAAARGPLRPVGSAPAARSAVTPRPAAASRPAAAAVSEPTDTRTLLAARLATLRRAVAGDDEDDDD